MTNLNLYKGTTFEYESLSFDALTVSYFLSQIRPEGK